MHSTNQEKAKFLMEQLRPPSTNAWLEQAAWIPFEKPLVVV